MNLDKFEEDNSIRVWYHYCFENGKTSVIWTFVQGHLLGKALTWEKIGNIFVVDKTLKTRKIQNNEYNYVYYTYVGQNGESRSEWIFTKTLMNFGLVRVFKFLCTCQIVLNEIFYI